MYNKKHLISLLGYLGIGFIGGAISHGFFSEQRSFIMAGIGIILFLISETLTDGKKNYIELFVYGLIYSLAVGMVSGGFQHFLDSPERSLWIVPVGFIVSLLIYPLKHHEGDVNWTKSIIIGFLSSGILAGGLYLAMQYLPAGVFSSLSDHHNTENSGSHTQHSDISEHDVHACLMGQTNQNCSDVLDPKNSNQYGKLVKSVCQMMPMPICETYFGGTGYLQDSHDSDQHQGHDMNHADMVTSEFDFVALMIPHHQEAVDTTIKLLQTTKNPQLIKLGSGIIQAQEKEIAMMKGRLNEYFSGRTYTGMPYMPMMSDTSKLTDSLEIDTIWTEDMIKHHQGALDMANKLLIILDGQPQPDDKSKAVFNTALRQFANDIIRAQSDEINQMKSILGEEAHDH